jgi:hypothetical protein
LTALGAQANRSIMRTLPILISVLMLVVTAATSAADDRVCCRRGDTVYWSTPSSCAHFDGEVTYNKVCRKGGDVDRICCKRLRSDWWSTKAQCAKDGGSETFNQSCRDDSWNTVEEDEWNDYHGDWEAQVCCQRGESTAMWTSARVCRTGSGKQTFNKACRAP